jgi:hypothetical protein
MKKIPTLSRDYNSRFTIIENKNSLHNQIKKSKTRTNQLSTNSQKHLNVYQNPVSKEQHPLDSVNIDNIFDNVMQKLKSTPSPTMKKKIKFDGKGSLTMISMGKEQENTVNKSKLDVISGSLVNNVWPGESLFTKDRISKFEPKTFLEISGSSMPQSHLSVNEKLKKTSQRARDLVSFL